MAERNVMIVLNTIRNVKNRLHLSQITANEFLLKVFDNSQ